MLGEFFLSTDDQLEPLLIESGPHGRLPFVRANGLTPVNIASLGEMLGAASYEDVLQMCGERHHESASGESGVWDVPSAVAVALCGKENLDPLAEQWVETEELQRDRWRAIDGLDVLSQLAELLTHLEQGQSLWYWWSL